MFTVFTSNAAGEHGVYYGNDLAEIEALVNSIGHTIEKIETNGSSNQA